VYAEASRYPGQEKQVIEFYQKTPEALTNLRAPLFEDKVIDFILEMAQVSARAVDTEELLKSPDELAADRAKEKSGTKKKQTRTKKEK
jgi:trigger factor